jgi:flagellin|tara:strand:- start:309 stop:1238 length:930 start_codon:yes stop_codon:yes gene_type:complete
VGSTSFFAHTLASHAYQSRLSTIRKSVNQYSLANQNTADTSNSIRNTGSASRNAYANGLRQAVTNISQANAMIETTENTLRQVTTALTRMRALTVQAGLDTQTSAERKILNVEFGSLKEEIQTLSTSAMWRDKNLLDGSLGAVSFQVGSQENQKMQITFADINTDFGTSEMSQAGIDATSAGDLDVFTNLATTNASTILGDETIDLAAQVITGNAQSTTLGYVDTAIKRVSLHQTSLTDTKDQLAHHAQSLERSARITEKAAARFVRQDNAWEIAQLTRTQILQQAGAVKLIQANQSADSVASLLRDYP